MTPTSTKDATGRAATIRARDQILGCEGCSPAAATPFYWVLDALMGPESPGSRPSAVLEALDCPKCAGRLLRETLVEWD